MLTDAQKKAIAKYKAKTYAQINLQLPKQLKDEIVNHIKKQNKTVNGYIITAIKKQMEIDNQSEKENRAENPENESN